MATNFGTKIDINWLYVNDSDQATATLTDFVETWSQGPTVIQFGRDHNGPDRTQRDRATPF